MVVDVLMLMMMKKKRVKKKARGPWWLLACVAVVELVGAETRDVGLEPTSAERDEVEAHVQPAPVLRF
jgi:hypothetical protein